MNVLITGHNGFIGSVMVPLFQKAGHTVVGLDSFLFEGCIFGPPTEDVPAQRVDLAGALNAPSSWLDTLGRAGSTAAQALRQVDALVQTQAVMLATNRVFFVTSFVFLLAALAVWVAPKGRGSGGAAAAAH